MKDIDRNSIDKFARESFGLLADEEKNPTGNLFYREGFAAGFKRGQEFESESGFDSFLKKEMGRLDRLGIGKRPVKIETDPEKVKELEKEWEKIENELVIPFNGHADRVRRLAQSVERRIFEVMTECNARKCYIVDRGFVNEGGIARWESCITCDESEAKRTSRIFHTNYIEHDFTNLLYMPDKEFDRFVTECSGNGSKNSDAVRKWRQTLKEDKA